jgi:hypothetical protein
MGCTLLYFEGYVGIELKVPGQPHRREVTPSELLYYYVSLVEDLTYMHWVVSSYLIVLYSLILTIMFLVQLIK